MCKFSFDWTYSSTTQHHLEERAVFAGCGARAVGMKELPVGVGGGVGECSVWRGWWNDGD